MLCKLLKTKELRALKIENLVAYSRTTDLFYDSIFLLKHLSNFVSPVYIFNAQRQNKRSSIHTNQARTCLSSVV